MAETVQKISRYADFPEPIRDVVLGLICDPAEMSEADFCTAARRRLGTVCQDARILQLAMLAAVEGRGF
jgi:hypothetical protein